MRKSLIPSLFLLLIIFLSSGCLLIDRGASRNINEVVEVNTNVTNRNNLVENDSHKWLEDQTVEIIKDITPKLRLTPLKNTLQRNELEFRLWINLGMPRDEKLLVVRSNRSGNQAHFYHLQDTLNDPIRFQKMVLSNPKDHWNTLLSEISNRLVTPAPLRRDPQFSISRHEGVICLEIVEKGQYQFVSYGQHTSFEDGKRLIDLCESLSSEFDVKIDCRGERTTLRPIR